jgi:DNA-binding protein H-NS
MSTRPTSSNGARPDQVEAQRHLAEVTEQLARLADIPDLDPALRTQADALRNVEAELQGLLRGETGASRNVAQLFSRAAQLTASGSAVIAALGSSGSAVRQEQMRAVTASIRQHEQQSRSIYEGFQKERTTPADPELSADVTKAQRAYEEALKTGNPAAIADAGVALHKARMADVAYAVGRGDPKAEEALKKLQAQLPARLEDKAKAMTLLGESPERIQQETATLKQEIAQTTRAAAEKGARDAGRSLSDKDQAVLGAPAAATEQNRFAALAPQIKAAQPETSVAVSGETDAPESPGGPKAATKRQR